MSSFGTAVSFRSPQKGRYVAYNRETKLYLHESCTTSTPDRNYAWSGALFQAHNVRDHFPISADFTFYRDGSEKPVW